MKKADMAVIFDMDGTIFDSERLVLECWEKVGERHGISGIREVFIRCIGTNKERTKEIVYGHYGQDFPYDKFSAESSALFHEITGREGLPIKPGVVELLTFLKEKEIPLGLASSTRLAVVTEELKQAGLYDHFRVVVGGDLLKNSKPAPDIYLMACERMGVRPEDTYAIEDSYNGIRSAHSAGLHPIMVPDMMPDTEEMRLLSDAVFSDLFQVKEYFSKMFCEKREAI
ncbi:MAG: HAD family phosphatase [Bacteroidales bacterium]|nr:HAD family phosphatase [Bacteroidales bacterium]MCM1416170.1 HAD family phosphatase [bacterium]MCM1424195.1 HAD family phosphatase [bacterium]